MYYTQTSENLLYDKVNIVYLIQYHRFIRDCAKEMKPYRYGADVYRNGFSSLTLLAEDKEAYVVYHELAHRFYVYTKQGLQKIVSIDPKKEIEEEWKKNIALSILKDDEETLVQCLKEHELVRKKVIKKLEKTLQKQRKKREKAKEKE